MMPTDGAVAAGTCPCASCHVAAPAKLSTPKRSLTNRLRARIETGASTLPRRHAASHGAAHTRPQMDGNGFCSRAMT